MDILDVRQLSYIYIYIDKGSLRKKLKIWWNLVEGECRIEIGIRKNLEKNFKKRISYMI